MKLLEPVRVELSKLVLNKYEELTGNKVKDTPFKKFLSGEMKKDVEPSTNKINWTIKDAFLNDKNVLKYLEGKKSFRGNNSNEKIHSFNGLKFYQSVFLKSNYGCPINYLDVFSIFIGSSSFINFIETNSNIKQDIKESQKEIIQENNNKESRVREIEIFKKSKKVYEIPSHLTGFYKGYFIRPKKPLVGSKELFSKLHLLICDNKIVYVRTTNTELPENDMNENYYTGTCYTTNKDTLQLSFSIPDTEENAYEFLFVFDIQAVKTKQNFNDNKFLSGIYAGADITTKKPVAGRLIALLETPWKELISKHGNKAKVIESFTKNSEYCPKDISDQYLSIFEQKLDTTNPIRDFFTTEERYVEDINVIKKYIRNPQKYDSIEGDFSIYSLSSNGLEIRRGIARIDKFGEVRVNGTKVSSDLRKFRGLANILKNDVVSISLYREKDNQEIQDDEVIFYLLKLNNKGNNGKFNLINGLRLMNTADGSHKPFSGRVVFVREKEGFYEQNKALQPIQLFSNREKGSPNMKAYSFLERQNEGAIINLLMGFENNIVKAFGRKREQLGYPHSIDYGHNFFLLAKYHLKSNLPGSIQNAIINLYYSLLHGKKKLLNAIKMDPEFDGFLENKTVKKAISEQDELIFFNESEIVRIRENIKQINTE